MFDAIQSLIQLQKLDIKLDRIERDKGDLPARVNAAKLKVDALQNEVSETGARLQSLEKEKRTIETEIETLQEKKKQNEEKLYAVTTNKEYDAVTLEIESVIKAIDEKETTLLETIEEIEKTQSRLDELQASLSEQQKAYQEQAADLQGKIALNADKESTLRSEREVIVEAVPERFLRLYERIRPSKDGLALVTVVKGACGGCFTQMPPQRVMEVRDGDKIIECESCGRILYWEEEEAGVPAGQ